MFHHTKLHRAVDHVVDWAEKYTTLFVERNYSFKQQATNSMN